MPYLPGEVLTDAERAACFRAGFIRELGDRGVTLKQAEEMVKSSKFPKLPGFGDIFKTAIVLGIPIGFVSHMVDKSSRGNDAGNRKSRAELEYYRDVVHDIRNKLSVKGDDGTDENEREKDKRRNGALPPPAADAARPVDAPKADGKYMDFGSGAY